MSDPSLSLPLTSDQLRTLTKMAYLAQWVVSAAESFEGEDFKEKVDNVEQLIFKLAAESGNSDLVEYVEEDSAYYPTHQLEDESSASEALKAYEEEYFWEELVDRLALQRAAEEVGEEAWDAMPLEKRLALLHTHETGIQESLATRGLGALSIAPAEG